MEIKLNKEIRDYSEVFFFGLNLRQFIFALIAVLISLAIYYFGKDKLSNQTIGWLCTVCAVPPVFLGFFKYQGLNAEQFFRAVVMFMLTPKCIPYQSDNLYYSICVKEGIICDKNT